MALTEITTKSIKDGEIVNADVNASAAIAKSKLASLDIVNADVNASAAIAGSKITPTFTASISTTAQNPNIRFDDSDTNNNGEITLDNTSLRIEADEDDAIGSSKISLRVDGSEKVKVESTGNLTITNGDLIIGTSPGNGIDFSATSDGSGTTVTSELFDDYEEGTFTATPADASNGGNASSTTYTGYYTKIGRQVTLLVKMLNVDSTGLTGTNDLFIQGIPYTSSGIEAVGASVVHANWSTNTTWINSSILENDAFVRFHESADNTSRDYVRCTEINDATTDIIWSLTYFTA